MFHVHLKTMCILPFGWNIVDLLSPTDLICHLRPVLFLLAFCSDFLLLPVYVSGVLKSPTVTVLMSVSLFMPVNVCLIYLGASMFVVSLFTIVVSFSWINPLITD